MPERDAVHREKREISAYVEGQAREEVLHLEKVTRKVVGPAHHEIWDVHCTDSRWWVVTNPTNLYSQEDFASQDVVLTFHVGLALRLSYMSDRDVPVTPVAAELLPGPWRRWQQAFDTCDSGHEAETFQAVGVHLRECLLSLIEETRSNELVPKGVEPPKKADFLGWSDLLADRLAPGSSFARHRSYLKALSKETWQYVNWLTHAKSAVRLDAEIGLKAVEHLLGTVTAARLRVGPPVARCEDCGSYEVTGGMCRHCGWEDPAYEVPEGSTPTDEERAERLAQPCVLSSDISTFVTPDDLR